MSHEVAPDADPDGGRVELDGTCAVNGTLRTTLVRMAGFYAACLAVGFALTLGHFQGMRVSLEVGTGGYIDNLKYGGVFIVPVFVLLEYGVLRLRRRAFAYDWRDSIASFSIYVFNGLLGPLTLLWQFGLLRLVEPYALFAINDGLIPFLVTFVMAEGAYYWYHRLSHEVPLLWAIHHTHHSARTLNLSIAFRLHTLGRFVLPVVYVPMILVGFKPEYILGALALSLVYQFFIHSAAIGTLGFFERSGFNTPSLHRVHHGSDKWCIDRNYAGVLIVWDRMFGTFQREIAPITFGVTTGHYSYNPVKLMLGPRRDWAKGEFARERDHAARMPGAKG